MDFFDFDAYERKSSISSSVEPPTTPSFSSPTIPEPATAPATALDGVPIPAGFSFTFSIPPVPVSPSESNSASPSALGSSEPDMSDVLHHFTGNATVEQEHRSSRDEDIHLEVASVAGQQQGSDVIGEDIEMSEDAEMEDVFTTDVILTAVAQTGTFNPSEPALFKSLREVPASSPVSEPGSHGRDDAQTRSDDEPSTSEFTECDKGTQQSEPSSDAVPGSPQPTSSPQEAKEPEEEAVAEETNKEAKEPKWEVYRILASAIVSDGLLYYRASWKGWGQPDYSMYPAHNFRESPDRLISFHRKYPKEPGPPKRLKVWKEAFDNGEELEKHDDDDLPAQKEKRIKERLRGTGRVKTAQGSKRRKQH